jgi:hypothetical protein
MILPVFNDTVDGNNDRYLLFQFELSNFNIRFAWNPSVAELWNTPYLWRKKFLNPQQIRSVYTNISSKILISRSYVLQRMIKLLEILSVHSNMLFSLLPGDAHASSNTLATLQRHNTENSKHIFPEKELRGLSPKFPHSCVCEWFIFSHDPSAYSAAWKYVDRSGK